MENWPRLELIYGLAVTSRGPVVQCAASHIQLKCFCDGIVSLSALGKKFQGTQAQLSATVVYLLIILGAQWSEV